MGIAKVVYLFSYAEYKGIGSDEGVDFFTKVWCSGGPLS